MSRSIVFLSTFLFFTFCTSIHSQKEFNTGFEVGTGGAIGFARGFTLGGNLEYKWNNRFSINSQLNYISTYRDYVKSFIHSEERYVTTNPTYFEDIDEGLPFPGQREYFLESQEDGISHLEPGKEFRHDLVLNNTLNYYFAIGDKWRHRFGLGIGVGIANESVEISSFVVYDNNPNTTEYRTEIMRRTKYIYLNAIASLCTEYHLSDRIALTASASYMLLPRFREVEGVDDLRTIDVGILSLTVGIKSIISYQ